jgi:hypothetical protein
VDYRKSNGHGDRYDEDKQGNQDSGDRPFKPWICGSDHQVRLHLLEGKGL